MISTIKALVKKIFRLLGMEVHSHTPGASHDAQIVAALNNFEIDLVLDVGANEGQFAKSIRSSGFMGEIVSFEPLSNAYKLLQKNSKKDRKWAIHSRAAVGSEVGKIKINISANSTSSSILPMLNKLLVAAPYTAYVGVEEVPIITIDSVYSQYINRNVFLKVDTQGYEAQVIKGAVNSLPMIKGVLLEMSLVPLYEGQKLWEETINLMKDSGFRLWAILPGFTDSKNGQTYQVDGVFFRDVEIT